MTEGDGFAGLSDEGFQKLNDLMESSPGNDASDEEIDIFMSKLEKDPQAMELLSGVISNLKGQGVLEQSFDKEEPLADLYRPPVSPARLMMKIDFFRGHLSRLSQPAQSEVWRRLSLPMDASFYDLHLALKDVFGLLEEGQHIFEVRDQGAVSVVFSSHSVVMEEEGDYCEIQNRLMDIMGEGVELIHYLNDFGVGFELIIRFEKVVQAGEEGTCELPRPAAHGGEGMIPAASHQGVLEVNSSEIFNIQDVVFRHPFQSIDR